MKVLPVLALSFVLGFSSFTPVRAEDAPADPATSPAATDKKPAKPMKTPRLVQPWSKMESLTPDQKIKIAAIHKTAVSEKKKIDDQEDSDVLALLSDDQKTEAAKVKEESSAAAKRKPKAADAGATTQPADGM